MFLVISYVKPSFKPKKDVRLTWGWVGEEIITLDIQLKCSYLNLKMFNKNKYVLHLTLCFLTVQ